MGTVMRISTTLQILRRAVPAGALLLSAGPVLAQAAEHGQPDITQTSRWPNAIWALGLFAVLLVILRRFAWQPVMRAIRDRERVVADTLADVDRRQREAQELQDEYRQRLQAAETEANTLLERARRQAEAQREQLLAQTRDEAAEAARRAQEELERARREVMEDIYKSTAALASELAGQILRREVKAEDHQQLIRDKLSQLRDNLN